MCGDFDCDINWRGSSDYLIDLIIYFVNCEGMFNKNFIYFFL